MSLFSKNPTTGEVFATYEEYTQAQVQDCLSLSEQTFTSWKNTSLDERKKLMHALASYLEEHAADLSRVQTLEMGKTLSSGIANIHKCAAVCRYYADNAADILTRELFKEDAHSENFAQFEPLGVIAGVMPWNFPYWQVYRFAIPAIMAGNVVVLKHASCVQGCATEMEKSFIAAGFPKGVFQNLVLSASSFEQVIRDERVRALSLTGSEAAGSSVAKIAGEEIKKMVLELGGSDPFIVFPDTDISKAAALAVTARMQNNVGQSCIAAKRFIVHTSIFDEFVAEVKKNIEALIVGDPLDAKTHVGPLATEQIFNEVKKQVSASVAAGAHIILGGTPVGEIGYFYAPTVLTNIHPDMPVFAEEVFGPVMPIIAFENTDEAIALANNTRYGLGASVITNDLEKAHRVAAALETGNVFINDFVHSDPMLPFGGVKKSGYGRELSHYGMKEFINVKNISVIKKL